MVRNWSHDPYRFIRLLHLESVIALSVRKDLDEKNVGHSGLGLKGKRVCNRRSPCNRDRQRMASRCNMRANAAGAIVLIAGEGASE